MFKPKTKRTISLAVALVFLFTVIMPMSAFADTDYAKFSSAYNYLTAEDEVNAGSATVKSKAYGDAEDIQIKLTLPSGVEFTDKPKSSDVGSGQFVSFTGLLFTYIKSDSSSITVRGGNNYGGNITDWDANGTTSVVFDFAKKKIDIDSDFTGNIDVNVEVWGIKGDKVLWSESDDLTIAKVAGSEKVMVSAKSPKSITKGKNKTGADIKVYETKNGVFPVDEVVVFDIMTNGVKFNDNTTNGSNQWVNWQVASFTDATGDRGTVNITNNDKDQIVYQPAKTSSIFPGDIVFTPKLDVDPDVTGEIEIRVSSAKADGSGSNLTAGKSTSTISRTTVVVATVGDTKAVVDKLEDNDTIAYSGQVTDLDVEITIEAEGDAEFKKDDSMEFTLNVGEFVFNAVPTVKFNNSSSSQDVDLYNNNKSFYVSFNGGEEKFTLSNFNIVLPNDVEPGDITLTIDGDYGDLGEVTIGVAAAPITLSAEKTPILAEALNQQAGDITITETGDGALKKDGILVLELPSGIELNGKPKLDVVEGNFDGDISVVDDKYIAIKVKKESSDASEIRLYNINYDTGRLALNGDVELKAYFVDPEVIANEEELPLNTYISDSVSNNLDRYDDTGVIARVANATVANENEIVATFAVGDEGVAVVNGRTLVQVNKLCDVLGMQKSWDEVTKTAYFVLNGKVVAFPMGENAIYINGTKIAVDQGGKIINDFTYATLRGIQMAFGGELDWDDATKTATFKFVK
ncbi:copper amine oxidase N-terminal domain-containing protein [Desulfallas thermosapovorans]|uniref:Copper amine oxidase-like protein n=1 Tax=Desulfallas thermosapovorans DSM 6562 TaxID=1121431 RepID=A0A5S4ZUK7_9FIRM|nr:copper amine oxidase N-terminal domain-containing protein [Desulfallas thermosapovorans]TYO96579.1 copper amine oxidase-like protein [Desulfallas thermosapovorans DSM 6562]